MAIAIDSHIRTIRARLEGSQLGQFFRWWVAELRALLPAGMRARMQHARRKVILQVRPGEVSVGVANADALHELDVFALGSDERLQAQRIHDLLVERELSEGGRDLLIADDDVLRKQVYLPAAAEANLRQALAFEMDRQTPFNADEVFYDYRILQRDRESAQLRIDLAVALREPVLRDIRVLESVGMAPTGADVIIDGRPAGLNLLPVDLRHRMVNSRQRANLVFAGAFLLLLVLVMGQSIWLRQHQLDEVREAIDEVRQEALQVQEIRERIKDASEAAGFLDERRAASVPTVKVLAEVTRVMPDDTYLDRLLISSDNVQMQGKSENAQRLIELVNQSPLFTDAAFRGPTRLDSRTQREIFDVGANLVPEAR
jgi:general secretion pathway protein L